MNTSHGFSRVLPLCALAFAVSQCAPSLRAAGSANAQAAPGGPIEYRLRPYGGSGPRSQENPGYFLVRPSVASGDLLGTPGGGVVAAHLAMFCLPKTFRPYEAVSFVCDSTASQLTEVLVSPRITSLRDHSLLAEARDPGGLTVRLILEKPAAGFAETHAHPFSHLGFDGNLVHGEPWCELAVGARACDRSHDTHSFISELAVSGRHGAAVGDGWPSFRSWPRHDTWTHMAAHPAMLFRAWRGGMRLMVAHALTVYGGCIGALTLDRGQEQRCRDEASAVRDQLRAAYWTEMFVRREWCAPGRAPADGSPCDWLRIVRTPQEARAAMSSGRLAMVLGIEVDFPFSESSFSSVEESEAQLRRGVDEAYACGVRHVFPLHFWRNHYGGPAIINPLTGPTSTVFPCEDSRYTFAGNRHFGTVSLIPWPDSQMESTGACDPVGLTQRGRELIRMLMARRMIIDVDHMSDPTQRDVLNIVDDTRARFRVGADRYAYPVIAGHAVLLSQSRGGGRQEGMQTPEELARIRDVGGMLGLLVSPGAHGEDSWVEPHALPTELASAFPSARNAWAAGGNPVNANGAERDPRTTLAFAQALVEARRFFPSGIAIGTDVNGAVIGPAPRPASPLGAGRSFRPQEGHPVNAPLHPTFPTLSSHQLCRFGTSDLVAPAARARVDGVTNCPGAEVYPHEFNFAEDGLAHEGMLPDLVRDAQELDAPQEALDGVYRSAEEYVSMWERADEAATRMGLEFPASARRECPWNLQSEPVCPLIPQAAR